MVKIINFIKTHKDLFTFLGLAIVCYFVFFCNIGSYALMDVDETRYVSMARDMFHSKNFLTLYLNGDYFFEKPPLYFWGECLSFAIFGKVNEFTARFPVALYGSLCTFLVYFIGKRIVSRRYGIISALILATSLEYVILAKFAILDIVVTTCIGFSILFGFMTQFGKHKMIYWLLFYAFSGLAVMAKGIPGFIVPFASMFFVTIANKSFKEVFKPKYILTGFALFLLIILPWHIIMFKLHDPLFFDEYIMKHHINRFFSSSEINRGEPFYFYFLTVLWGLIPWVFSGIAVGIEKIKEFYIKKQPLKSYLKCFDITNMSNAQKLFYFATITAVVTILFFSASSTKLVTYILPIYFFTSIIMGFIWENYIFNNKHQKSINISVYLFGGICLLAAIVACFMKYFIPANLYDKLLTVQWFSIIVIGGFGISSILCAIKNWRKGIFATYVIFILVISAFGSKMFYNLDYQFGQNDLMGFAKYALDNNKRIVVLNSERRYSVLYYYGKPVYYISLSDEEEMAKYGEILDDNDVVVVIKQKKMAAARETLDFDVIIKGEKYSLVKVK